MVRNELPAKYTKGLKRGDSEVEQPDANKERGGHVSRGRPPAELAALSPERQEAAHQEQPNRDQREQQEEHDGEGQVARVHAERHAFDRVRHRRDRPREPDAEEHVHRVRPGHVPDRRIGRLLRHGSDPTRKRVCEQ